MKQRISVLIVVKDNKIYRLTRCTVGETDKIKGLDCAVFRRTDSIIELIRVLSKDCVQSGTGWCTSYKRNDITQSCYNF